MAKRRGSQKATERLAWLGRLISHPLRIQILAILYRGDASASEIATELGEPLEIVAYHVRLLHDAKALELVEERRVKGARERTFAIGDQLRGELESLPGFKPAE
jgi:DNA-binding transcriptional ArsR family regulator